MSFLKSPFWEAVGIIGSMIIGSGIFALPYAVSVSGLWGGLIMGALAFFLILSIHLAYGEIVSNTNERHRLPGYVKFYLGNWAGNLSRVSELLLFNIVLLTYSILAGIFLVAVFGGNATIWSMLFFLTTSLVLLFEPIERIGSINFFIIILVALTIMFISIAAFGAGKISNLPLAGPDPFFAFGVFVFALAGLSVIADAKEIFKRGKIEHKLKAVIILTTSAPFILYIIFILAVLMATGSGVSRDAISGLSNVLGGRIILIGAAIGALSMFSSFLALGYDLKEIYELDLKLPKILSWVLSIAVPAALFFVFESNFTKLISIMGGIFIVLDGFFVILILRKMRRLGLSHMHFLPFKSWQQLALIFTLFLSIFYELVYQVL